uniref:Uncharacterized protein n=1 Tax=Providencia stuartii TaxID=588 RepID=A0AAI9D8G9_PROST|nr:hypothetical protein [Providencia stuartii]
MRKYISLVPALIVALYSLIAFFEGGPLSAIASLNASCAVSLCGVFYLSKYLSFTAEQRSHFTLSDISIALIPFDPVIYRAVLVLNVFAVFGLITANQWFLVPLFLCWLGWQYLVRRLFFGCTTQKAA